MQGKGGRVDLLVEELVDADLVRHLVVEAGLQQELVYHGSAHGGTVNQAQRTDDATFVMGLTRLLCHRYIGQ